MKRCIQCAKEEPSQNATVCSVCGGSLEARNDILCPNCGTQIVGDGIKFCPVCGAGINSKTPAPGKHSTDVDIKTEVLTDVNILNRNNAQLFALCVVSLIILLR